MESQAISSLGKLEPAQLNFPLMNSSNKSNPLKDLLKSKKNIVIFARHFN